MTEVRFYHLQKTELDKALPDILTKALGTGKHVIVKAPDKKMTQTLNEHLWTYHPDSFLPHGSDEDGHAESQPIWLTEGDDNPNKAKILVLIGGATADNIDDFDLCCEMLNGKDNEAVKKARDRWKTYKDAGFDLTYWMQDADGKWQKKD